MKLLTLLALTLPLCSFCADAPDYRHLCSGGAVGKETIEELHCSGVLKLNGTTINLLSIAGSLVTTSAHLGAITVRGEANLRNSKVTAPCTIYGYLRAQDSTFEDHLTLGAHKAVFTATHLTSITVQKEEGFKAKQIIELKQGSTVSGPIHFESGKGEVHSYNSKVTGPITGGKLIKK